MKYAEKIAYIESEIDLLKRRVAGCCCRDPKDDAVLIRDMEAAIAYYKRLSA